MNDQVRAATKEALAAQGISQGELARRTGMARPAVTKLLSGTVGKVPDNWQRILDEIGLELIAVPKSR